jgi:hypothetical protein
MSRMQKDRGEARGDASGARLRVRAKASKGSGAQLDVAHEGEFARAFADALRDILIHERRRAA